MSTLEVRYGVHSIERAANFLTPCGPATGADSLEILLAAANGQKFIGTGAVRGVSEALANVIQGGDPWGRHSFLPVSELGKSLAMGGKFNPAAIGAKWNECQRGSEAPMHISKEELDAMLLIAREHFEALSARESLAGSAEVLIENADIGLTGYDRIGLNCLPALDCVAHPYKCSLWTVALLSPLEVFYLFAVHRRDQADPPKSISGGGRPYWEPKNLPKVSIEQARALVGYAREVTGLDSYFK